jgi:hypothetical protein
VTTIGRGGFETYAQNLTCLEGAILGAPTQAWDICAGLTQPWQ